MGTKVTAAPGPLPPGLPQDSQESRVTAPSPAKQAEQHGERPGCLDGEKGRSGKPTETVGTGWGELRVGPCGTLTRTVPGLAREVGCVRGQALPCMEQQD